MEGHETPPPPKPEDPNREVGKAERTAFRTKVATLPRHPVSAGEGMGMWSATFKRGDTKAFLLMPIPGESAEESGLEGQYSATITEPTKDNPEIYTQKHVVLDTTEEYSKGGKFSYEEKFVDDEGEDILGFGETTVPLEHKVGDMLRETVDPQFRQERERKGLEKVGANVAAFQDEETVGGHVVTQERYNDVIGVLNSLTTKDEIATPDPTSEE